MRSIAHFPTGGNRKRGRRIPSSNINKSNGWRQSAPVWGRSSAAVVAISSSPSNSSVGSSGSSGSRSLSRSPVPQSPVWGRSARVSMAATRSPRQTEKTTPLSTKDHYQQGGFSSSRSRSPSPQSPALIDDNRDEVTITTITPSHSIGYQQRQLLAPQSLSSSPKLSHELCTIAEDRRISSNTLSQMVITSTAEQIAKSPVLAKRLPPPQQPGQQQQQQQQDYLARNRRNAAYRDPYNDDYYDDSRDQDCADCWAYHKSGIKNWWPFGEHSETNDNNNKNISTFVQTKDDSGSRNTADFPIAQRRIHVRRTSF